MAKGLFETIARRTALAGAGGDGRGAGAAGAGGLAGKADQVRSAVRRRRRCRCHGTHSGRQAQPEAQPACRDREYAGARRHRCGARGDHGARPTATRWRWVTNGAAISVATFKTLPFDPVKDFAMVSMVGTFDLVFVVNSQSEYKTLAISSRRRKPIRASSISAPLRSAARKISVPSCSSRWPVSMCRSSLTRIRRTSWWRCCATTCR